MTPQELGLSAEYYIRCLLVAHGRKVKLQRRREPFDMLVDGRWRVEVKAAQSQRQGTGGHQPVWKFNIHRHGKVEETDTDLYILRLENVPFCRYAVYLLFKAPVKAPTITISFRSLLNGRGQHAQAFRHFCRTGKLLE